MDYESFRNEVKNRLLSYLPKEWEGCRVEIHTHYKVNLKLDAVTVRPPEELQNAKNAYPVFYVQDLYELYQAGNDLGRILRYAAGVISKTSLPDEIAQRGMEFEDIKENLMVQVINAELNEELLRTLPHRRILDLAVIYRVVVISDDGHISGMPVTHDLRKSWNVTEKILYDTAMENTPAFVPFQMRDTGQILFGKHAMEAKKNRMLFLSNSITTFGAAVLLYTDILDMAAEELEGDMILMPASLHEIYAVKDEPEKYALWRETVRNANQKYVSREEWLSDCIYKYSRKDKTVTLLL